MFPLWHGKVATGQIARRPRKKGEFPLWHGKVATVMFTGMEDLPEPGFRFGMVKLQLRNLDCSAVCVSAVSALAW